MTDLRAALGAHRADQPCEHCGAWPRKPHERTCPKAKRGRTSRRRGNDYEREVAARLGARRVGQYGSKVDVEADWIVAQVKNGASFPETLWRWLSQLPHDAQHLRALVIGDAPGAGTKRREVIVLDFGDFCDWYGGPVTAAPHVHTYVWSSGGTLAEKPYAGVPCVGCGHRYGTPEGDDR